MFSTRNSDGTFDTTVEVEATPNSDGLLTEEELAALLDPSVAIPWEEEESSGKTNGNGK